LIDISSHTHEEKIFVTNR